MSLVDLANSFGADFKIRNFRTILEASDLPLDEQNRLMELSQQANMREIASIITSMGINGATAHGYQELLSLFQTKR